MAYHAYNQVGQPQPNGQVYPQAELPAAPQRPVGAAGGWEGNRFDCFNFPLDSCCISWCCPCVVFGLIGERVGRGNCCLLGTLFVAVSFIVTFGVAFLYVMMVGGEYVTCSDNDPYCEPGSTTYQSNGNANANGMIYLPAALCIGLLGCMARKNMVQKYAQQGVQLKWEGDCVEYLLWVFCSTCSLCQEYRTVMRYVDQSGNWVSIQQNAIHPQTSTAAAMPGGYPGAAPAYDPYSAPPPPAAPTAAGDDPLPSGWQTASDASGNTYYYNSVTNDTTWERPLK